MFLPSFGLKSTLATNASADFDDTLKTKKALGSLGYYETPEYGLTRYPDTKLFEGIKDFQTDYGLKVDGVMKPGGETENALGTILNAENISKPTPNKSSPSAKPVSISPPIAGLDDDEFPQQSQPQTRPLPSTLDALGNKFNKTAKGVLGPAYTQAAALLKIAEEMSPGANIRDMLDGSRDTMEGIKTLDPERLALGTATMLAGLAGLYLPANVGGAKHIFGELLKSKRNDRGLTERPKLRRRTRRKSHSK